MDEYIKNVSKLAGHAKEIPKLTQDAQTCEGAATTKAIVVAWKFDALRKSLNEQLQTIDNASVVMLSAELAIESEAPVQIAALGPLSFGLLQQDRGSAIGTPKKAQPTDDAKKDISTTTPVAPMPGVAPLEDSWQRIKNTQFYATQLLNSVGDFVQKATAINVPITLGAVAYNATQDQPATLAILRNGEDKPRNVPFVIRPYSAVAMTVDGALLYSLVEAHHYGTKMEGTELKIVRADSGDSITGTSLGAMLSIVPRRLLSAPVGYALQLGISPVKDKIGLFTGVALRLFDRATIGGGFALQQAQRLSDGLSVGQVIATPDDLKTRNSFRPGGYVTFTFKVLDAKK